MASIRIRDVSKSYGEGNVVDSFSVDIADGEFLVLVGPSGCGKSTMLKILAGLEPASQGSVYLGERDVTDMAPADRDVAMVFQNYALYPHLSVRKNIGFGLRMRGLKQADIDRRVAEAARILGVEAFLDRRPRDLSGGQRQRVALGRAIVREPQAFLMDEPLSNLDAKLRVHMRAEIGALHKRLGVTTVYVTHDQIEAMTLADRVVIMRDGKIQQIASPDGVFRYPSNLFVASFIGSPGMNLLLASVATREGDSRIELFGRQVETGRRLEASAARVVVGLRPEHLALGEGPASFRVRPSRIESLGSEKYLYFDSRTDEVVRQADTDEERAKGMVARVSHTGPLAEDTEVTLSFDPENLYFFDAGTGDALD